MTNRMILLLGILLFAMATAGTCDESDGDDSSSDADSDTDTDSDTDSDADGDLVGCDWFEADNCWKPLVADMADCMEGADIGTFNADRTECSHDNGILLTFATPVPGENEDDSSYEWNIDVIRDEVSCMTFQVTYEGDDSVMTLSTQTGTFVLEGYKVGEGEMDFVYNCPNGDEFLADESAIACGLENIVGFGQGSAGDIAMLGLLGNPDVAPELVNCAPPK